MGLLGRVLHLLRLGALRGRAHPLEEVYISDHMMRNAWVACKESMPDNIPSRVARGWRTLLKVLEDRHGRWKGDAREKEAYLQHRLTMLGMTFKIMSNGQTVMHGDALEKSSLPSDEDYSDSMDGNLPIHANEDSEDVRNEVNVDVASGKKKPQSRVRNIIRNAAHVPREHEEYGSVHFDIDDHDDTSDDDEVLKSDETDDDAFYEGQFVHDVQLQAEEFFRLHIEDGARECREEREVECWEAMEAAVTRRHTDTPVNGREGNLDNVGDLSTMQVAHSLLRLKIGSNIGNETMDDFLKVLHLAMGSGSNMPATLWKLEHLLHAKSIDDPSLVIHVCPHWCRIFDAEDPDDTVCETARMVGGVLVDCQGQRYHSPVVANILDEGEEERTKHRRPLQPKEMFYYIPIEDQIRSWAGEKEFWEKRASPSARDLKNLDFWGGKLAKQVNAHEKVKGRLLGEHACMDANGQVMGYLRQGMALAFGYDHYPVFKDLKKQHSTGVVGIQLLDVDPEDRSMLKWQAVIAIHKGPSHKGKPVSILFEPLWKELNRLMSCGMQVSDSYLNETYTLFVYLGYWNVDTVARMAVARTSGTAGYMPDSRSGWRGKQEKGSALSNEHAQNWEEESMVDAEVGGSMEVGGNGDGGFAAGKEKAEKGNSRKEMAMRLRGYSKPEFQPMMKLMGIVETDEECFIMANDERLFFDHDIQVELVEAVENGTLSASFAGRIGRSPMAEVPYFDSQHGYVIPFVHSTFYGVVKNYWKLVMGKLDGGRLHHTKLGTEHMVEMKRRSQGLQPPKDGFRRYACIVDKMHTYIMEDWMMWTIFYSPAVLGNVLRDQLPEMAEAWDCLRKAIIFYLKGKAMLQHKTFDEQKRAFDYLREHARKHMWRHAELMETHGPAYMMTLNMRQVVVHLYQQEEWTGAVWRSNEWWLERIIGFCGRLPSNLHTLNPELVMGNAYMGRRALEKSERLCGRGDATTIAKNAYRRDIQSKRTFDQESLQVHLVGPSSTEHPTTLEKQWPGKVDVQARAMALIREQSGDDAVTEGDVRCFAYERCSVWGESITSKSYLREKTRVSCNVTLATDEAHPCRRGKEVGEAMCDVGTVHRYYMAVRVTSSEGNTDSHRINVKDDVLARFAFVTRFVDDTPPLGIGMGLRVVKAWGEALVPLEEFLAKCILHYIEPKQTETSTGGSWVAVPLWGMRPSSSSARPF